MIKAEEYKVLEDAADAPMCQQVIDWATINSGTTNLIGLHHMASQLANAFSVLPANPTFISPDPVQQVSDAGQIYEVERGQHLLISVRPEAPLQLLFTGHMDTVFPADHPFQKSRWLSDGVLNGPGTADMKAGLSVMLAALSAIEKSPLSQNFGYDVLINSDEETGSHASARLIAECTKGKDAAFTYEPSLPDGGLAGARPGSGNFSIIFHGRSAHAGRNPQDGRNALLAAADLALQLSALKSDQLKVNPARIDGGGPNNVVPDMAILRVNLRPSDPAAMHSAVASLQNITTAIERSHDVRVEIHGGFNRPPKPLDVTAKRLFHHVKSCGEDLGFSLQWQETGGVCDGNNIAACGVPVVDTMGPRGGAIHSSDEYLIVESLAERAQLSALTILRFIERGGI